MNWRPLLLHFYPRSHVGNDSCRSIAHISVLNFYPRSHVGNDKQAGLEEALDYHFYPRSHVGNDDGVRQLEDAGFTFLSTFPRRERLQTNGEAVGGTDFYPRSHVGND